MDRVLIILGGLLLNAAFAGPRRWFMRLGLGKWTSLPGETIRTFERKLNREHRTLSERETRGFVVVALALLACVLLGTFLHWVAHALPLLEWLVVACLLSVRSGFDIASEIRSALRRGDIPAARAVLAGTPWRYHALMDEYALARAAIETLAVHFSQKILAPALWYLVFGLPGLFASRCMAMMEETLSQPAGEAGFNKATKAVYYVIHYIPSRLAAIFWVAAMGFLPGARVSDAMKWVAPRFAGAKPAVLSVVSAAAVLKLSLGGPTSVYAPGDWLGSGTARPTHTDIKRAQYLFALLHLFLFILFGLFF